MSSIQWFILSHVQRYKQWGFFAEYFRFIFRYVLYDNAINFQIVLKKAIAKYGVPKKLFVDNGGPYKNDQLSMICASLGIALIHSRPYSPKVKRIT